MFGDVGVEMSRCKGMRDLLPQEMAGYRRIEAEFRDCCQGWGYQEVRTPTLEYLHLFTAAGTLSPEMLGRVYSFLDWDGWSGERVVLRPDGTIPAARLYVENFENLPVARFSYVENVFAFEGTGSESRERWQCGAEFIGGSKLEGDVELISLALETMARLDIGPVELRVAHAGVLRILLESLGLSGEQGAEFLDQVFAGNTGVLSDLEASHPEAMRQMELIFGLKGSSPGYIENLRGALTASLPALETSFDELARIAELLTGLGYDYQIDFTSGRGFEYYTGVIFSFYCSGRRLGGGGRYDELVSLVGGKDVCASGFALYSDELINLIAEVPPRERILLRRPGDAEHLKASLEVSRALRDAGYVAEFDLGFRETTGFRWIVDMSGDDGIELTDVASGEKWRRTSCAELLELLQGATCRQ